MNRLQNKTAVITGAANGIGLEAAKLFNKEGANVHLVDIDEKSLKKAAEEIDGDAVAYTAADVSKEDDVKKYVNDAVEKFGGIDVFINNAGIEGEVMPVTDYPVEEYDKLMSVNLRGSWLGLKHVIPEIKKRGGGSIVISSSVAGVFGSPGVSPYVMSKHGLIGMAKAVAQEVAGDKIRVNTVNPSPVETRMMRSLEEGFDPENKEQVKEGLEQQIPLGRYAEAEEIAELMLFLASDESKFITGAVHMIDGGMTASP